MARPTEIAAMQRRTFLQRTGLLMAGGAGALAGGDLPAKAADADAAKPQPAGRVKGDSPIFVDTKIGTVPRKILITSAESALARALAAALGSAYRVRLTGRALAGADHEFVKSDLGHSEATHALVRGLDAVVHVAEPPADASDADCIDHRTRCTYNLLRAAVEEGVRHAIYLSSLEIMTGYQPDFEVTEDWLPLPGREPPALSAYLGECVCREFAREGKLSVVVLRLGKVVRADQVAKQAPDPLWVDERDAAQAVSGALSVLAAKEDSRLGQWSIFHIASDSPGTRFSVAKAKKSLGYKPQFRW